MLPLAQDGGTWEGYCQGSYLMLIGSLHTSTVHCCCDWVCWVILQGLQYCNTYCISPYISVCMQACTHGEHNGCTCMVFCALVWLSYCRAVFPSNPVVCGSCSCMRAATAAQCWLVANAGHANLRLQGRLCGSVCSTTLCILVFWSSVWLLAVWHVFPLIHHGYYPRFATLQHFVCLCMMMVMFVFCWMYQCCLPAVVCALLLWSTQVALSATVLLLLLSLFSL